MKKNIDYLSLIKIVKFFTICEQQWRIKRMIVKTISSYLLNKKNLPLSSVRNFRNSSFSDEIVDLAWISEIAKQDLTSEELVQTLHIIENFIEQKREEMIAETDFAKAFKSLLIEKYIALKKDP